MWAMNSICIVLYKYIVDNVDNDPVSYISKLSIPRQPNMVNIPMGQA